MTGPDPAPPARLRPLPPVFFLDIEASALDHGYPIEIAWVDALGHAESHLIRPADIWLEPDGGFSWSVPSEGVHGIPLATLLKQGRSHRRVARRVLDVLGRSGAVVVSDQPEFDQDWLNVLFTAAGIERRIEVALVDSVYRHAVLGLTGLLPPDAPSGGHEIQRITAMANEILRDAEHRAGLRVREHRALPDARNLWRQWTEIRAEVARRIARETAP